MTLGTFHQTFSARTRRTTGLLASIVLLALCSASAFDRHGPIAPIAQGAGADGPWTVVVDTVRPQLFSHTAAYRYRPQGHVGPLPVIFVMHGFGLHNPAPYEHLLRHIASRGYCAVFPAYRVVSFPGMRLTYGRIYNGMLAALHTSPVALDTSRIGFVGHSFGAGAIPSLALRVIDERGWGATGLFMHIMAPFYFFNITPRDLASFPGNVNLIVEVFEKDNCNDHRMAKDLYQSIAIPSERKDFILLLNDTCSSGTYVLAADHMVPFCNRGKPGVVDGMDYYGVFRLCDALAMATFEKDSLARTIALGNNSPQQRFMGVWPDGTPVREAVVADDPPIINPQTYAFYRWANPWNPRRDQQFFP